MRRGWTTSPHARMHPRIRSDESVAFDRRKSESGPSRAGTSSGNQSGLDLRRRDGYISISKRRFGHRFNRSSFPPSFFSGSFTALPPSLPFTPCYYVSPHLWRCRRAEIMSLCILWYSLHYFLLELSTGKGSVERSNTNGESAYSLENSSLPPFLPLAWPGRLKDRRWSKRLSFLFFLAFTLRSCNYCTERGKM